MKTFEVLQRDASIDMAEDFAIQQLQSITRLVRILNDTYETFPELNNRQPSTMGLGVPMSFDEWAIMLEMIVQQWRTSIKRRNKEATNDLHNRTKEDT